MLQLFARLKERDLFGGNFDALSRLGVASYPRTPLASTEAAKAADLNLVAGAQRAHHAVKNGFHDHFTILAGKFRQTRNFVDQIGFGHDAPLTQVLDLKLKLLRGLFPVVQDELSGPASIHNSLKFQALDASCVFGTPFSVGKLAGTA